MFGHTFSAAPSASPTHYAGAIPLGAVLLHSTTPSLRVAGFEDEDDDEYENEAPCEGGWSSDRYPRLKPRAESCRPFGTEIEIGQIRNSISPTLRHAARQNSRTVCPTKPTLYSPSRPCKRGTFHDQDVGEVGRTSMRTRRQTPNAKRRTPNAL